MFKYLHLKKLHFLLDKSHLLLRLYLSLFYENHRGVFVLINYKIESLKLFFHFQILLDSFRKEIN